jgi:hypothetical protein
VDAQCAFLVEEGEQGVDFGFGLHGQFLCDARRECRVTSPDYLHPA